MSAHTPGPWTVGGVGPWYISATENREPARLIQSEYDANLMAAAPELLAALRDSVAYLWDNRAAFAKVDARYLEIATVARAAINKAEGGKSYGQCGHAVANGGRFCGHHGRDK